MHRSLASRSALALLFAITAATTALAQQQAMAPAASPPPAATPQAPPVACAGALAEFLAGVKADAIAAGASAEAADKALAGAQIDPKVLSSDHAHVFVKQTFLEFTQRTFSQARLDIGRQKLKQFADVFARAEQDYGV
ncbi:lytic murein transglycosylase, partial [Rhizobium sp. SEMIA 4085]|uniref:lytic murein transglycosylase n=1 Tax=Rhizobium sp. SEMIA 4085 TaxID=2137761 RepID=UPI00147899CB